MKKMLISLIFAHFAAVSSNVYAQTKPQLYISVEGLDDDARQCNVTDQTLRAPAILTLRNNRIEVSLEKTLPFLFISANLVFLEKERRCVYGVNIRIVDYAQSKSRNGFSSGGLESIDLCDHTVVGISNQSSVSTTLSNRADDLLKACLSKINY